MSTTKISVVVSKLYDISEILGQPCTPVADMIKASRDNAVRGLYSHLERCSLHREVTDHNGLLIGCSGCFEEEVTLRSFCQKGSRSGHNC